MSQRPHIIIVGGVAAGASAATKARRTSEDVRITVYEKGPYVSFANCGLPYYLSGAIAERDSLLISKPEDLAKRFALGVHTRHEVIAVDAVRKTVTVRGPEGKEFEAHYDRLILATGSSPIRPPLPGIDGPDIHTLTTIPEAEAIHSRLVSPGPPRRALVVGLGPIGLEVAEAFMARKIDVTLVDLMPQVLPALDPEMAAPVASHLEESGATLILGDAIAAFHQPRPHTAQLRSGREVEFDLAVLAIGVRPRTELATSAGLAIGETGGIIVDHRMQTSDPSIFAAGDIVETHHLVTGSKLRMPMAGPANRQGRTAGANAAGGHLECGGVLGTFIVRAGSMVAGKTGLSEREAAAAGIDYVTSFTHSPDHATYYPGAQPMVIKLVVERQSGRLLGAQVCGRQGVDKRIDILATAIAARMTAGQLCDLDLAYAPPFSSARGPAIVAGMVAANVVQGQVRAMAPAELLAAATSSPPQPLRIIDVRTTRELTGGVIPGAIHIPLDVLRGRLQELGTPDPNGLTVVYCRSGQRSYLAARILEQNGWPKVHNLAGGYLSYQSELTARRLATAGQSQ